VKDTAAKSKYPVKSLVKALRILDVLGESQSGSGVTEISKKLRIGKSTVHRLLTTLKDEGFVLIDPITARYILGSKIAKLEEQLAVQSPLLKFGVSTLEKLVAETKETSNLAILQGSDILYIAKQEPVEPLRMSGQVGRVLPAYSTALGKVLLSGLPDAQIRSLLRAKKLRKFTPNTVTNMGDLLSELAKVRRDGFAEDREEMYLGLQCIAAPVRDYSGSVVAGISVSVPKHRMTSETRAFVREALHRAALELSEKLGFVRPKNRASG